MQEEKQFISPIKQRILSFVTTLGISKREFYVNIGVSRGTLESKTGITEDVLAKFIAKYPDVSPSWLLTGEGSMLRNSKNTEEPKLGCTPNATPISPAEEYIIYKMYKDEKEEKDRMLKEKEVSLKEKESKIDHLQSELRAMTEELATLKAKCPEPATNPSKGLGPSETAPHAPSHPHSPTSDHYYGGSCPPHQENQ